MDGRNFSFYAVLLSMPESPILEPFTRAVWVEVPNGTDCAQLAASQTLGLIESAWRSLRIRSTDAPFP